MLVAADSIAEALDSAGVPVIPGGGSPAPVECAAEAGAAWECAKAASNQFSDCNKCSMNLTLAYLGGIAGVKEGSAGLLTFSCGQCLDAIDQQMRNCSQPPDVCVVTDPGDSFCNPQSTCDARGRCIPDNDPVTAGELCRLRECSPDSSAVQLSSLCVSGVGCQTLSVECGDCIPGVPESICALH